MSLSLLAGCGEKQTPEGAGVRKNEHIAPHHGTPVVLGNEEYHLELVLDSTTGKLRAYVMDGEIENFVRIQQTSFDVVANLPSNRETLSFKAVPNNATGESVGDTSLFEVETAWLRNTPNFDARLKELSVRGQTYYDVDFNFPKGNDTDEKK